MPSTPSMLEDFTLSYPEVIQELGVSRRTVQRYVNQRAPFALDVKAIYVPDGQGGNTRRAMLFSASQVAEVKHQMTALKAAHTSEASTDAARTLDAHAEANAPHPVVVLMQQLSQATDLIVKKDEEIAKLSHALGQFEERSKRLESDSQRWVDHYKAENVCLKQQVDESLIRRQQLADAVRQALASRTSWRTVMLTFVCGALSLVLVFTLWKLIQAL